MAIFLSRHGAFGRGARRLLAPRRLAPLILVLLVLLLAVTAYGDDETPHARTPEITRLRHAGAYEQAIPLAESDLAAAEAAPEAKSKPGRLEIAQALQILAELRYKNSEYATAESLCKRGLEIREKECGSEDLDVAASLNTLAALEKSMDKHEQSEKHYLRALAIREKALGPEHPDLAKSLNGLALLYVEMSELSKAEQYCQRGLDIRMKSLDPADPILAGSLATMGTVLRLKGEHAQAEELYLRGLDIREKALGPRHPDVATSLNSMGMLYRSLGAKDKAEQAYLRALEIREQTLRPEHMLIATTSNNLGLLYTSMGEFDKAEHFFKRSLSIKEKNHGAKHKAIATTLHNLAFLYKKKGDYAASEQMYLQALAIKEQKYGPEHTSIASTMYCLAELYDKMGAYAKAEQLYLRAMPLVERRGRPSADIGLYGKLSRHFALTGAPEAAIVFGKRTVNAVQAMRGKQASLDKDLQEAYTEGHARHYHAMADLLMAQGRLPEALQVLRMLKEQEYSDFTLRGAATQDAQAVTASFLPAEEIWIKRFSEIRNDLGRLSVDKDALEKKAKSGELSDAELQRLGELDADLVVANMAYQAQLPVLVKELKATPRANEISEKTLRDMESLKETLRNMGEGAALAHFLIADARIWILLTTPGFQRIEHTDIPAEEFSRMVGAFRVALVDPNADPRPLGKKLYDALIAPITHDLETAGVTTLMLSLDGELRYIPLAALHDGQNYLIERYRLALYTDAARNSLELKPSAQWKWTGMGVSKAQDVENFGSFPALSAVPVELDGIRAVLPGETRLDEAFTRESLRAALLKQNPVVHIASHFYFHPGAMNNSFLLLGSGKPLSLAEFETSVLNFRGVDLLTLSACKTAVGGFGPKGRDQENDGREVEGLAVLAQRKQAKAVLATLWSVADDSTGQFMRAFYKIRQEDRVSTAEALRRTQRLFIEGAFKETPGTQARNRGDVRTPRKNADISPQTTPPQGYAHPFYWAPFILMGNWL